MGRKATNIEEQIKILKDRGMLMDMPLEKIKEILHDIGYYRLGFYWQPFELDGEEHVFKRDTKFSDVIELYYYNSDLRYLLLRSLNRIEINFRSKVIYEVSNHYNDSPTWFADRKIVKDRFVKELPKIYDHRFKTQNLAIKKHHRKYINDKYAPAWKTLEYFSFGSLVRLYENLKSIDLQHAIAKQYNVRNKNAFLNHMKAMLYIRNICAHSGVLYDVALPKGIKYIPTFTWNSKERNKLSTVIQVILYYLKVVSISRSEELRDEIENITESTKSDKLRSIIQT